MVKSRTQLKCNENAAMLCPQWLSTEDAPSTPRYLISSKRFKERSYGSLSFSQAFPWSFSAGQVYSSDYRSITSAHVQLSAISSQLTRNTRSQDNSWQAINKLDAICMTTRLLEHNVYTFQEMCRIYKMAALII